MPLLVRAYPVLPGKEEAIREFAREFMGSRGEEAANFYRCYDILRETWHFQTSPLGPMVIVVTEVAAESAGKAEEYAQSQLPFDRWFKENVQALSGIDNEKHPLGPLTELMLAWNGERFMAT